jgi:hypothetical protein
VAIEENEINDRAILEITSVETGENGQMQRYVTKLPSGKPLESNWMTEADRKRALIQWVEAVRSALVNETNSREHESLEKLREIRRSQPKVPRIITDNVPVEVSPGRPTLPSMAVPSLGSIPMAPPPTSQPAISSDPFQYMREQLKAAKEQENYWSAQLAVATIEKGKASALKTQWQTALEALSGVSKIESTKSGSSIGNTVDSGPDDSGPNR